VKQLLTILCVLTFALTLFGCSEETPAPKTTAKPSEQAAKPAPEVAPVPAAVGKTGKVTETMNAAGYTYIQVDTGSEKFWAAAPEFSVKAGDDVVVPEGMPMPDYHSKTLDRTFEMVYFVPNVMVGGEMAAAAPAGGMPGDHPPTQGGSTKVEKTEVDLSGINKAEGGLTIAEVYAKKADLSGKAVTVRGKVVKFSPEIMGKNWIHLQDGSGEAGSNDLTVTTDVTANLGDTVVISGNLAIDKDFGYGYKYDLILEEAVQLDKKLETKLN